MPETITEMIIPGVYIEVRAEGLIGAGGISLANIGVVGSANKGPVGQLQILSGAGEAATVFGAPGQYGSSDDIALARALDLLFAGGARTVYAVRVGNGAVPAVYQLKNNTEVTATLTARTPGTWANDLTIGFGNADGPVLLKETVPTAGGTAFTLKRQPVNDARAVVRVTSGTITKVFAGERLLQGNNTGGSVQALTAGQVRIGLDDKKLAFAAGEQPAAGAVIEVTYAAAATEVQAVTVQAGAVKEKYLAPDGAYLADLINATSQFFTAKAGASGHLQATAVALVTPGTNGTANKADIDAGFNLLANEDVHIVCAPGLAALDAYEVLNRHCQAAVENGRERIGVMGTHLPGTTENYAQQVAAQATNFGSDRILFVAPGVKMTDKATGQTIAVNGSYAAAAVAGLISRLSAHQSPTNKELTGVAGLERELTPAEIKLLLNSRAMPLHTQGGVRVVRGLTTSEAPWSQVTTRRIVDYAKAGIRAGARPYIGRLNNDRVRQALKGTLDGLLTAMVQDEMLIAYELNVSATRDDEINNRCVVTATLRPTFSIDFIKVLMNLE